MPTPIEQCPDAPEGVIVLLAGIRAEAALSPAPPAVIQRLNASIAERVSTPLKMPAASRND
jgi:hypothetical protein